MPRASPPLLALVLLALAARPAAPAGVEAVVLGIAQDAGVPQANCRCPRCATARVDPGARHEVASLALLDPASGSIFLIDATPSLPRQLEMLAEDPVLPLPPGRTPLAGVLLTHAHMGHYAGLVHFGREAMAARALPVFASDRMAGFLESNAPWSELTRRGHICLERIPPDQTIELTPSLHVRAIRVPHRDELSDTVAYLVEGPRRKLLWLPDIDSWDRMEGTLEALLDRVDYAFLDATFYARDELPDRNLAEIGHPLAAETARRVARAGRRAKVFLVHLNHSNALLDPASPACREVAALGVQVAHEGLRLGL